MNDKAGTYEGRVVGNRRLDCLLGVRGNTAFYLNEGNGSHGDQLVEVLPVDGDSVATMASWKRAGSVPEERLLRVHATGAADLDGTSLIYAVLDLPDDDLSEILSRGKLDEMEARSMFIGVADALHRLHQRGLAHGAVTPANIFVVNNAVRLSVDMLAPAGKNGKERDLRQFGGTLVKALTGCADNKLSDAPAIARAAAQLDSPFRQIAVGCVGGSRSKWTAVRIVETLSGRAAQTPARLPIAAAGMAAAGIAAVGLLMYGFFHTPRHPVPVEQAVQRQAAPVPAKPAAGRPLEAKPEPPKPEPPRAAARPQVRDAEPASATSTADRTRTEPQAGDAWAVIAGTYGQFEAAQKHADMYHKQFPDLQPHVSPLEGQSKHYRIVLASGLTQDAAERIRHDVVEQGAPLDTYIAKMTEN